MLKPLPLLQSLIILTGKRFSGVCRRRHTMNIKDLAWHNTGVSLAEFNPSLTLVPGQSFTWKKLGEDDNWVGLIDTHPIIFSKDEFGSHVASLDGTLSRQALLDLVYSYLQLHVNLQELYTMWAQCCPRMAIVSHALPGIRLINQDPFECLISFIFSSNNNIKRITKGLDQLRARYGQYSCTLTLSSISTAKDGATWKINRDLPVQMVCGSADNAQSDENSNSIHLFTFPTVDVLASVSEETFREMGLGYRAKFLVGTTRMILEKGETWLLEMRSRERNDVQGQLIELPGVGRKVADCVALFSMNQCEAVPVDTHVWDIVLRDYSSFIPLSNISSPLVNHTDDVPVTTPVKFTKTLTPCIYDAIGSAFRKQFKNHAGWAHSVLFAAELPDLRKLLPTSMQQEMASFAAEKSAKKKSLKRLKSDIHNKICGTTMDKDSNSTTGDIIASDTKFESIKSPIKKRKKR